jgi:hypothetical protein
VRLKLKSILDFWSGGTKSRYYYSTRAKMTRRDAKRRVRGVYRSRKVVVQPPPAPAGPALGWPPAEDVQSRKEQPSEEPEG